MIEVFDAIDQHLAAAGSIDRAAIPGGFYVAWCANLGLLTLPTQWDELVMRVKLRDASPIELYVAGCAGTLSADYLTPRGVEFTRGHFERYLSVCEETFGADVYRAEPSWDNYERLARVLTVWLLGTPASRQSVGRLRRWWQRLLS